MPQDVSDAFVKQYEADVHLAYQRRGSLLRNTVRIQNGVVGASTTFQKLGAGTATQKVRHGRVTPMNPDHSNVECLLGDWYAGDWVDMLDLEKIKHDERQVLADTGAFALGRKTDEMIIAALNGAEAGSNVNLSAFTIDTATAWVATLGGRDVPMELGSVFGVVGWALWAKMLTFPQFSSQDYVADDLPFKAPYGQVREWAGCIWMPHSGLTGGSGARECHVFHRRAVGHAIGQDVKADITWNGPEAAWFVNNMMSQGSVLIDGNGVVTRVINEGA